MADVTPASDDEVRAMLAATTNLRGSDGPPYFDLNDVLALIARIDAEKARADRAEAERERLREQVGALQALLYLRSPRMASDRLTGEAEADG